MLELPSKVATSETVSIMLEILKGLFLAADSTVPTVPLSALVPKGSRNLLVAGRCVSSDRLANSGLRVQASCMAMGQAAGATAALAAQSNTTPLDVPLKNIRATLRTHGAITPSLQGKA